MTTTGGLQWSSRLTFLMASVGCAVGLGNIWLFPYMAGENGGGAFVLVYLLAIFAIALPMLMSEFMLGRRGAAGPPVALAVLAKESGHSGSWSLMGILFGVVGGIMALSFYGVVGGWTIAYVFKALTGQLQQLDAVQSEQIFGALSASPGSIMPWFTAFIVLTILISARGLHEGVERAVKFMMPTLFVMLVALVVYAAVVGEFGVTLRFLFAPDFSKLDFETVLAAIGTAFFSVSVGLTNMMAYGSYIDRDTSIPDSAAIIVGADTIVALLAGLAIFPIVFASGLEPGEGPGLVFQTLPIAFGQIPGGAIIGAIFFLLLFLAALTSSIGMLEAPVSWLRDGRNMSRRHAALLAGGTSFVLGTLAALSFSTLSDFHPLGAIAAFEDKTFFLLFIYLVTQVMMPLGGVLIAVFAGWLVEKRFSQAELFAGKDTVAYRAWLFLVRYVSPVVLAFVLVNAASS